MPTGRISAVSRVAAAVIVSASVASHRVNVSRSVSDLLDQRARILGYVHRQQRADRARSNNRRGAARRAACLLAIGSIFHGSAHSRGGMVEVIMLPDTYGNPTRCFKHRDGLAITLHCSPQLRLPVPLVRRRLSAMLRAGVPEAGIDEDSDPGTGEHHIRSHSAIGQVEAEIFPETQPRPMQPSAQLDLRFCIRPSDGPHVASPTFSRGDRLSTSLTGEVGRAFASVVCPPWFYCRAPL